MDFQILRPGDPIFQEWLTSRGHRGCERQFLGGTLQDLDQKDGLLVSRFGLKLANRVRCRDAWKHF